MFAKTATAQNTTRLTVNLVSLKKDSLLNVTIQLYLLPDTSLITSQLYKAGGNTFPATPFSKYLVRISSVNFETAEKTVSVTDKPVTVAITVKRKTTSLQNVTVVAKKPLIKQEDDKSVIDATVLANSSTNAYEVLEKTPGTIVDQDGNVYLSSLTPATVYINGREMKLSSEDLASLLKSLPAASVSKIEILRSPSAKYDAASSGGIVNIVLKKGVKLGSNGSVNIGYFQGVYSTQTAGFNLNKSAGKINSYFSYQFSSRKNYEELNSDRLIRSDTSFLSQKAYTTYPSLGNYIGGGVDIAFTKKFSINYDIRLNSNNNKSYAINGSDVTKLLTQSLLSRNQSDISNKSNSLYIGNEVSSKYKIDSAGSEWTIDLEYNYYRNNNTQLYNNYYFQPVNPTVFGDGINKSRKNIFVAETELVLKLPKIATIETGIKLTKSISNNSAAYFYETGGSGRQPDTY